MRILVTGHNGYLGSVLVPLLNGAHHTVVGLDSDFFADCTFSQPEEVASIHKDIRDVTPDDLEGFDAVVHLAAVSNDPMANLNPLATYEINLGATLYLAALAKAAGVERFVFASSCSLYGAGQNGTALDEDASLLPLTPYGVTKALAEAGLAMANDDDFSVTCLRNGTLYGISPRLRVDLVVNNLVGYAVTTGVVALQSDGMAWRPLLHVEDAARAVVAVLEADRELVHGQAFNVGSFGECYLVRDIADLVAEVVPEVYVAYADMRIEDKRSYRVDCSRIAHFLDFSLFWELTAGIEQIYESYVAAALTQEEFSGSRYQRVKRILELQAAGVLDERLRLGEGWVHQERPLRGVR